MISILKELKDILNIKKKYYILNVLVAKGHGAWAIEHESFIEEQLKFKDVETIISDIETMREHSKAIAASLKN